MVVQAHTQLRSAVSPERPVVGTPTALWTTQSMIQKELGDYTSDDRECPVDGCHFISETQFGVSSHFGTAHTESEKHTVLLNELLELADMLGETPGQRDVDDHSRFSAKTYKDQFGSYNAAIRAVDLEPNRRWGIPKNELLDELNRLANNLEKTPNKNDMDEYGRFSVMPYYTQFDSWVDALEAADLDVSRYVYTATQQSGSDERRRIKIGITTDPERRMAQLTNSSGRPVSLRIAVRHPNAMRAERELHDEYGQWRIHGEWFMLTDGQIDTLSDQLLEWAARFDAEAVTDGGEDEASD